MWQLRILRPNKRTPIATPKGTIGDEPYGQTEAWRILERKEERKGRISGRKDCFKKFIGKCLKILKIRTK